MSIGHTVALVIGFLIGIAALAVYGGWQAWGSLMEATWAILREEESYGQQEA